MDVGEIRQRAQNQAHLIEDLRDENDDLHERAEQAEQTAAEQRERIVELEE